jgi:uncharacterized protein (DUF1778 family)
LPFWRHFAILTLYQFTLNSGLKETKMTAVKQTERVSARVPQKVYKKLLEAAGVVGATLNQFLVQSAIEKADQIIEHERVIKMTKRDANVFFHAVEGPPPINDKLLEAMKAYQEAFPNVKNRRT